MKWLFWLAVGLIAYTYVGYAGWLRLRMLWRSRAVLRRSSTPMVSIAMVVRNEGQISGDEGAELAGARLSGGSMPDHRGF